MIRPRRRKKWRKKKEGRNGRKKEGRRKEEEAEEAEAPLAETSKSGNPAEMVEAFKTAKKRDALVDLLEDEFFDDVRAEFEKGEQSDQIISE